MTSTAFTLSEFDLRGAAEEEQRSLWELIERLRAERRPDDPPRPFAQFVARNRNIPNFYHIEMVVARRADGAMLGLADFGFDASGGNEHAAQFEPEVLPEARRQGIGRAMLAWGVAKARAHGRRLLMGGSSDRVPAGAIFAERVGARRGLENRISQLALAELDRGLLREWQARASERAAGFELLFWADEYPDEHIAAFAALCEVMNSAPRDGLELEDEKITPEKLRSWLASSRASGIQIWTIVARDRASGALAGYSDIFINPSVPSILNQGATAVDPAYRNRGLGRWIKAAMLERVLRELPEARFVRTGNAESNAPMLAINVALGFRPYEASTYWQLETDRAAAYLGME